jgi:DNA repair protein RadC
MQNVYKFSEFKLKMVRERRARRAKGPIEDVAGEAGSIRHSGTAARVFRPITDGSDREMFVVLILDVKSKVIGVNVVSIGALSGTPVHPREVFKPAILGQASAIIVAHNHPSGDTTPSREDREITERLRSCGDMLGIPVMDHLILGNGDDYYSFADNGGMPSQR